jgi:serine/threonine protein kinase
MRPPPTSLSSQAYHQLRNRFKLLTNVGFDLLLSFLQLCPERRITAEAALDHPYFRETPQPPPSLQLSELRVRQLRRKHEDKVKLIHPPVGDNPREFSDEKEHSKTSSSVNKINNVKGGGIKRPRDVSSEDANENVTSRKAFKTTEHEIANNKEKSEKTAEPKDEEEMEDEEIDDVLKLYDLK